MQDVIDFISHFKGAEETFLHGCCYWFAFILQERFHEHGYLVDIYHDPVVGHFVARFIRDPGYKWMYPEECLLIGYLNYGGLLLYDHSKKKYLIWDMEKRQCERELKSFFQVILEDVEAI